VVEHGLDARRSTALRQRMFGVHQQHDRLG
jgi:hypothetical protein